MAYLIKDLYINGEKFPHHILEVSFNTITERQRLTKNGIEKPVDGFMSLKVVYSDGRIRKLEHIVNKQDITLTAENVLKLNVN